MYACSTYGVLGNSASMCVVRVCMYACSTYGVLGDSTCVCGACVYVCV